MRTLIYRLVVTFFIAGLPGVLTAQELPRKELDDAIKAANDARVQELTADLKSIQKAIAGGIKGFGGDRRNAIIAARKKESEIEGELAKIKKTAPMPELDIEKLAVGQVGKLFRGQVVDSPLFAPSDNAPGGVVRLSAQSISRVPVDVRVVDIIDGGTLLVSYNEKLLWLRITTAGMTTGQKLTLNKPAKVIGTKPYGAVTIFELAFFAATP